MKSVDEWIVFYPGANPDHLAAAVTEYGVPELVAGVVRILGELDPGTAITALLLMRDACLEPADYQAAFRVEVERSDVIARLRTASPPPISVCATTPSTLVETLPSNKCFLP